MPDYRRILITGAAGNLGSHLRTGLAPLAETLRLADVRDLGHAAPHEELVRCDLSDRAAALAATRDCEAIVHFAGHPREQTFEEIVADTLPASYHMFEGARLHGVRRVIYASSIHAVGFHPVESVPDTRVPHRPDTFYGLTKTFTEDLASLYWDKFGIESVMLRICSCFPGAARPPDAVVVALVRRLRAAGRGGASRPAHRLLGDLRHLGQRRGRGLERPRRSPRLPPSGQRRSLRRRRSRPHRAIRSRRYRHARRRRRICGDAASRRCRLTRTSSSAAAPSSAARLPGS